MCGTRNEARNVVNAMPSFQDICENVSNTVLAHVDAKQLLCLNSPLTAVNRG